MPKAASWNVLTMAGTRSSHTGRLATSDTPRSPLRTANSQRKYWMGSGWSNP